ncbi:GNAT family N-acetyltransferase [bacterium]|jgi:GNAT superfamily N-acetyltransferase|uniref:GNAT family N-acetyltransferase n=1 Tax=Planktomarina temperata TaxID=1284658 RepID=UPI000E9B3437|nr:GNAT family N-acetyltransferase [Planktomarina temperata]MDC0921804.1 GNAT family N-acetyltransferase [bacterium]MDA8830541.1 GNAT family N-acetyltransferase [Planktomarina temperata]MDA9939036.1 GNAT family N-acetyltransferase [Planktomarina temperata]MDC1334547.1 GNAT family N-acetyltransferase [Planktomarina temperata]
MSLKIRPLVAEDRADWGQMWGDYLSFYDTDVAPEIYETTFARLINPANQVQNALVAERDGAAVGIVHYIYHAHNWRAEDVCYLQDLYAKEAVRGQGIGRALIEAVYAAADANGTPSVYWMTQDFNENARLLYDRIGTLTPFIKYSR